MNSGPETSSDEERNPGVPGFKTWRGVYVFILVGFATMVGLIAWFTHTFAR